MLAMMGLQRSHTLTHICRAMVQGGVEANKHSQTAGPSVPMGIAKGEQAGLRFVNKKNSWVCLCVRLQNHPPGAQKPQPHNKNLWRQPGVSRPLCYISCAFSSVSSEKRGLGPEP